MWQLGFREVSKLPKVREQVSARARAGTEAWLTLSGLFPTMLCNSFFRGVKEGFMSQPVPQIFPEFSRLSPTLSRAHS